MALAAPLTFAWVWQHGLASMGDDSFSYLTLAHYYAPGKSWADQWAWQHGHLAPLFPLALLVSGGSTNFLVAHLLVAAFAVLALGFAYAFAARMLGSRVGATLLVAAFLLTPTAWISIKGIMSESLYLLFSFAALWFHAARLDRPGRPAREWLVFGVLLACAYLTRSAGIALVLAYGAHAAIRAGIRRERPAWPMLLPALPVAALAALWIAVRPGDGSGYRDAIIFTLEHWADRKLAVVPYAGGLFQEGWVASFHADVWTDPLSRTVFLALLAVGLAGAARNAWRNRLDGWYVLIALAITFFWMFPQDASRRLLYPVVLLVLLHAAEFLLFLTRRLTRERRLLVLGTAAAFPLLMCVPAAWLMFQKASLREPVPGSSYAYSDTSDYFLFVNEALARSMAGVSLATLTGFDGVATVTPPGAKVMWMRPEYVALLAHRDAIAWENDWDSHRLAKEIERTGTDYVISGEAFKADVNMTMRHPTQVLADVPRYSREVLTIVNPATRRLEFILYEIDRGRLAQYLREREGARAPG
jgi:hypothetical protein